MLKKVLEVLGDPLGRNSASSCLVSATHSSNGRAAVPLDWTIEPRNQLLVIHGSKGEIHEGSRAPFTIGSKTYKSSERLNRANFVVAAAPVWLGRALNDTHFFVSGAAQDQLNGQPVITVYLADATNLAIAKDSLQVWYFDATTLLPVRVNYKIPALMESGAGQDTYALFAGFSKQATGTFPTQVSTYRNATISSQITVSSVMCSPQIHSDDYFAAHGKAIK